MTVLKNQSGLYVKEKIDDKVLFKQNEMINIKLRMHRFYNYVDKKKM